MPMRLKELKWYVYYDAEYNMVICVHKSKSLSKFKHFKYDYIILTSEDASWVRVFESDSESYDRPYCFLICEL